jgi:hypothetical protein
VRFLSAVDFHDLDAGFARAWRAPVPVGEEIVLEVHERSGAQARSSVSRSRGGDTTHVDEGAAGTKGAITTPMDTHRVSCGCVFLLHFVDLSVLERTIARNELQHPT